MTKNLPAALAFVATLFLAGCSATVSLEPADQSNDPNCAEIVVRLPELLAGLSKRVVNAQSTAAWGDPTAVILRCGLEGVEVSSLPCVTAGSIDYLVDDSSAPNYRFITFARSPATEIIVDSTQVAGVSVLEELSGAIGAIPASKNCTEIAN